MKLKLADIRIDGGTQPRGGLDYATVASYAQDMSDGDTFPPVDVYHDGKIYWLADGFHRHAAALQAELKELEVTVHQGTQRDAVLFSVGANVKQGLRRTNADKRRSVERLLTDEEWGKWSNNEIAKRCGVSHQFVNNMRSLATVASEKPSATEYVTKHGTVATMNTANIGKKEDVEPIWLRAIQDDKFYPLKGWIKLFILKGFDSPKQMVADKRYATTWSPILGKVLKGKEYWKFTGQLPEDDDAADVVVETEVSEVPPVEDESVAEVASEAAAPVEEWKDGELEQRLAGKWTDNAGIVPTEPEVVPFTNLMPAGWFETNYTVSESHREFAKTGYYLFDLEASRVYLWRYETYGGAQESDLAKLIRSAGGHPLPCMVRAVLAGYGRYKLCKREPFKNRVVGAPEMEVDVPQVEQTEPEVLPVENRVWLNSGGVTSAAELNAILPAADENDEPEVSPAVADAVRGLLRTQVQFIVEEYTMQVTAGMLMDWFEEVLREFADDE